MGTNGEQLATLDRAEALRLLRAERLGRVVYTADALPAIQPVAFLVDDDSIVIRAGRDTTLARRDRPEIVAFEVDDIDPARSVGWSVVVTGRASEEVRPPEVDRLAALLPAGRAGNGRYIRISCDLVAGRRMGQAA